MFVFLFYCFEINTFAGTFFFVHFTVIPVAELIISDIFEPKGKNEKAVDFVLNKMEIKIVCLCSL